MTKDFFHGQLNRKMGVDNMASQYEDQDVFGTIGCAGDIMGDDTEVRITMKTYKALKQDQQALKEERKTNRKLRVTILHLGDANLQTAYDTLEQVQRHQTLIDQLRTQIDEVLEERKTERDHILNYLKNQVSIVEDEEFQDGDAHF